MKYLWLSLILFAVATSAAFAEEEATDIQTETTQNVILNQEAGAVTKEQAEAAIQAQPKEEKRNKWDFSDRVKKKDSTEKAKKDKYERSKYDRGSYVRPKNEWVSKKDSSNYSSDK